MGQRLCGLYGSLQTPLVGKRGLAWRLKRLCYTLLRRRRLRLVSLGGWRLSIRKRDYRNTATALAVVGDLIGRHSKELMETTIS